MITSSSILYISQVLAEPQNLSDIDKESINALITTYPYFMPARYMDAAHKHKKAPYANDMMSTMQLFTGNWLMYDRYLQAAMPVEDIETEEHVPTAQPEATIVNTPEIEHTQEIIEEEPAQEITNTAITQETIVEETANQEPVIHIPVVEPAMEAMAEPTITASDFIFGKTTELPKEAEPLFTQKAKYDGDETDESFILPVYTEDYFLHQGMQVSNKIPEDLPGKEISQAEEAKALMVMMSFAEWLTHFKSRKEREAEEAQGQKAVKTMWQKEKLAAALEEENEEIPEKVFEMAVNSITNEDDLVSESLAEVHLMQGRHDKAIEMYRKLSLRNPQKKAYFARKIEVILKDKQS